MKIMLHIHTLRNMLNALTHHFTPDGTLIWENIGKKVEISPFSKIHQRIKPLSSMLPVL